MTHVMLGTEVAASMKATLSEEVKVLKDQGVVPTLAIVRVGARGDDLAYERGAKKCMEFVGIDVKVVELPEDINQADLERTFKAVNDDAGVHGILLFQPLPKHLQVEPLKNMIHPVKDIDGMSPVNIAKIFEGDPTGYAPCTAEAVMALLDFYDVTVSRKRVTVLGRSMVVGKPLSMLFLQENATVTICHTKTVGVADRCREADILVAAAGRPRMITADMVAAGGVVVDVGINVDEDGNLCGDVDFESVEKKAFMISPVPRGVGSVTTSILASHVVRSAKTLTDK